MNKDCELAYMCQKGDLNNACGMPETHIRKECFRCDYERMIKYEQDKQTRCRQNDA